MGCCPCWRSQNSHDYSEIPNVPDDSHSLNGHKKKKDCHVVFQSEVPPQVAQQTRSPPPKSPPTPKTPKIESSLPEQRPLSNLGSPIDNSIKFPQNPIQIPEIMVTPTPAEIQSFNKELQNSENAQLSQIPEDPIDFTQELINTEASLNQKPLSTPTEQSIYLDFEVGAQILEETKEIEQEEQNTEPPPGFFKCKKCEQYKSVDDFSKNQLKKFKNSPTCKACT